MNKVFLVDDDYYVRKGLLELIDWVGCGYQVIGEADNGEDALELIKYDKPDLVVTDIRMPVVDGLDLIKELKESTDLNLHFIIISGYNDFEYAQSAMRHGVHDFILKPVDKEEFETTLKRLAEEINKEKMIEKSHQKSIAISTLNQLLKGKVEMAKVDKYIQDLNLKNVSKMRYMFIEINDFHADLSEISDVIQNEIEFMTQNEQVIIKEHSEGCFGTLVTDKQLDLFGHDINQFVIQLQQELSRKLNKEVTLYLGEQVKYPYQIRDSYQKALETMQYKYTVKANEPIYYDDIKNKQINYIKLDQSRYDQLMEFVNEHHVEGIHDSIREIFNDFQTMRFARDAIRTTINRCVHEVIRNIKIREGSEYELTTLQAMLNWEDVPLTLEQIKKVFTEFVLEGSAYIFKLNQDRVKGSIHKVKEYVDNHYQENLTLKDIAKKFYMNPAYLGQLFKKEYGIYFRDYNRQVRINEAKKRLRQTDLRVYEIAEEVGFENPDYFVTQFRKEVGMTPMNYRKEFFKSLRRNNLSQKDGDNHEAVPY